MQWWRRPDRQVAGLVLKGWLLLVRPWVNSMSRNGHKVRLLWLLWRQLCLVMNGKAAKRRCWQRVGSSCCAVAVRCRLWLAWRVQP